MGDIAYQVALLLDSRMSPTFNIPNWILYEGPYHPPISLPDAGVVRPKPPYIPQTIVDTTTVQTPGGPIHQFLIQWFVKEDKDNSWISEAT